MTYIDGHIHIHKSPYTLETIFKMVDKAVKEHLTDLYILEHTHKFSVFKSIYVDNIKEEITLNKFNIGYHDADINDYINLIKVVTTIEFPVKLHFGLEVCYFPDFDKKMKPLLNEYKEYFDFYIGSVHHVFGASIDVDKNINLKYNQDDLWKEYYRLNIEMVNCGYFTFIGHPDLIKLFGLFPKTPIIPYYEEFAKACKNHHQEIENNTGSTRYGYPYPGISGELERILIKYNVKIHKSSDAHHYEDIARLFSEVR